MSSKHKEGSLCKPIVNRCLQEAVNSDDQKSLLQWSKVECVSENDEAGKCDTCPHYDSNHNYKE
jgi:hypothetical protein